MRKFSENFRDSLRGINEINTIISFKNDKKTYILTTETNDEIITEANDYLEVQFDNYIITEDNILSVNPTFNTDLFKTVCKTLEIETKENIPIGTKLKVKVGIKVGEKFEYMDYGYYYIKEISYNANENYYHIIAYDKMYKSMILYDENKADIKFPITIKDLLIKICDYLKWSYNFDDFINYNKIINTNLFEGQGLTYRDILDNISQVIVGNLMFDENDILKVKYIDNENNNDIIVEEQDLRNINVDIKEKYGPVNSLVITTNDNIVLNNLNDEVSINENGKTELQIDDNYILINDSDNFIENMFNKIKGLQYYIYDINTIGLLVFEPLDRFKIKINDSIYSTIMLNNDLTVTTGLKEDCYVDEPDINFNEYKNTNSDKNKLNNALISLNKANAEIQLKANKSDVEASLELKVSKDDNDQVVSMINASANEINLKSNRLAIDSDNFKLTKEGDMTCSNANITGGKIELEGTQQVPTLKIYNPDNKNEFAEYSSNGIKFWKDNGETGSFWFGQAGLFAINGDDTFFNVMPSLIFGGSKTGDPSSSNALFSLNISTGAIRCVSLTQTSLKENKKNFEKYSGALEEIKNIDIYKYNLKDEEDDSKKHLGFVIGDDFNYSKVVTSGDNKGVDNYSFTSLCLQAIKEQQEQIESLQKQVSELKEMIKNG